MAALTIEESKEEEVKSHEVKIEEAKVSSSRSHNDPIDEEGPSEEIMLL